MHLKLKRILLLTVVFVYFISFFFQSNFVFFQTRAKEKNVPRVNIVAVLVDDAIYDKISTRLKWYTTEYVQKNLSDTKALVIPLDLENIHAYDIYRMLENIYFDGLEDVNSSMVGLIMFGDIPLPVVNQNGYIFPTIYPYVDFENQKYVWDSESQYFVPNDNFAGQAEIWHGLINYGTGIQDYLDFFDKVEKYSKNPSNFIGDGMWYDDFISQKEGFLDENYAYYRNRILFAEDLGYQRYSPLMKKMFEGEKLDDAFDVVSELEDATEFVFEGKDLAQQLKSQGDGEMHTTKMIQQEIDTSFVSDYNNLFSQIGLSTMRENVFAGGRWIKEYIDGSGDKHMIVNSDSSSSKIQLKDEILLGNSGLQGLFENLNDLMEKMVDEKIEEKNLAMDIVLPVSHKKITKKRILFRCTSLVDSYENYYFGRDARLVDKAEDLSIYRGTYRNLSSISGVSFSSLLTGQNSIKSTYENTDLSLKSVGGSYDIFSNQAEGNRGYALMNVESDWDVYTGNWSRNKPVRSKTLFGIVKKEMWPETCSPDENPKNCEGLFKFAKRRWGGASSINLAGLSGGRYVLSGYAATGSWRPIFEMDGFQSLPEGDDEGFEGTGWVSGMGSGPQWAATNFSAFIKYASPTQREGWKKSGGIIKKYTIFEKYEPNVQTGFDSMNYWDLSSSVVKNNSSWSFSKESDKIFKVSKKLGGCGGGGKEEYSYKVISSVVKHTSTTDDQINGIDRDRYGENGTLGSYYNDVKVKYQDLLDSVNYTSDMLSGLVITIESGSEYMNTMFESLTGLLSEGYKTGGTSFHSALNDISEYLKIEDSLLKTGYESILGLYPQDVLNELEYLAYIEGGNPEDYTGSNSSALVKIGFLPSRIQSINSITGSIRDQESKIISNYEKIYSLIQRQREDWLELAEKLKSMSPSDAELIDEVSRNMEGIFMIEYEEDDENDSIEVENSEGEDDEEGEEEIDTTPRILTGGTVLEAMDIFDNEFLSVSKYFSNLIEEDMVGPAIIEAAESDRDFLKWMQKNSVDFNEFTDVDWINNYAQWAKGPGYDSDGAKKNHDLLVGVSEHEQGMNILTPDRPIDSPRYVSMQSVAGNEMKFIYPDLFKVEVYTVKGNTDGYNVHELLSSKDIKKSLVKYLSGKADEYNDIVENECKNAKSMNDYFLKLKSLGYTLATPEKSLHSCSRPFTYDDFVESLGGEEMLDTISEMLYYQNLTNTRKLSTGDVVEDIELIKKSFSLNDKREKILQDYLVEGNERTKNLVFEVPTYESLGYEVAFINSDGKDYIFPSEQLDGEDFQISSQTSLKTVDDEGTFLSNEGMDEEDDDECNLLLNDGSLPLFKVGASSPWLKGLECWWKKTKESPFKVTLSFDSSFGEILDKGFNYFEESDIAKSYKDWKTSWKDYLDDWDVILNPDDSHDADVMITQMQVNAENHNQEVVLKDDGLSNLLSNVKENIRIETSNLLLSDSNPSGNLKITSVSDIGYVNVTIKGIGDGCLKIDSVSLCDGNSFTTRFNPKEKPLMGVISSDNHVAGKVGLVVQIGNGSGYIEYVIKYSVSPSTLNRFDLLVEDSKAVAGTMIPVSIIGYDKYNNIVSWGLEKYTFTVSQGRFLKDGVYQESFTTNDLRNLNFYYQAPSDATDGSNATIQIKSSGGSVLGTYNIVVVQGNPVIKLNGKGILDKKDNFLATGSYKLTSNENIYSGGKLDISKLQKLELDMVDSKGKFVDVNSQVLVASQNGLLVFGTVNTQGDGNNVFVKTSKTYMESGHVVIYFYPTTVAGDDIISITIPGLDTRIINYKVYPAETSRVKFDIKKQYVELGDKTDFEIFTSDVWGNPTNATLYINYDPVKVDLPGLKNLSVGNDGLAVGIATVSGGYLKTSIKGIGAGLTEITAGSYASIQFKVDKHILPESGLNVLYLNYFGNDRGNQWGYFSDNDKRIETMMTKSDKIITTTTQLVSENKIKKIVWKIDTGFKINNFGNIDTTLTIGKNDVDINIGGLSRMSLRAPTFKWLTSASLDTVYTLLNNKNSVSSNYIFFIPSDPSYKIVDGVLFDEGERVISIVDGEIILKLIDSKLDNGDTVRSVVNNGVNYGNLIIHYPNFIPKVQDFVVLGDNCLVNSVFSKGSSDEMSSVGIFDGSSYFELGTSYKSIQNSDEIDERIGFIGDFKNITLFGEGEIVGEATKKFGSEFLINLGDPVLSRKGSHGNVYGTTYDGGIGQEIYADSENDIFGVYQIDFNKDGLKDWIFVYLDGTIKLAKNYGGSPDLRSMQELMRVAVHINDVFVGDADGNGYEDIIVHTNNGQIRAYLNKGGKFDVDGSVVCLNQNVIGNQKSSTPSDMGGLNQFFVEDMDLDGKIDIVTYDKKGYVKVFYGGSSKNGLNYLSTEKYSCDAGWYDRQVGNFTEVTALGVQISSGDIFDNSMMRWVGMSKSDVEIQESDLSEYGVNFDINSLENLVKDRKKGVDGSIEDLVNTVMDTDNFDLKEATQNFINQESKFLEVTLYENTLIGGGESKNYLFTPSSFLDPDNPEDHCSVWKNYYVKSGSSILMDGDVVTVKVTVKASDKYRCIGSYGDIIQGPWDVYYDENNIIKGLKFSQNQGSAVVKRRDSGFSYIVDNIVLDPGEEMVFEYDLKYHSIPLKKMSVTYDTFWSNDKYPDIKLQSVDGCVKDFDGFINDGGGKRSFSVNSIPLQELIDNEYINEDKNTEDFAEDVISYGSDVNKIPGIIGNTINRTKLIEVSDDESGKKKLYDTLKEDGLQALNVNLSVDLDLFKEQTDAIEDIVDDITKGMCNGFSFGGSNNCKGLPVPFNQAFLAPGKYHLFGCWELPMGKLENGVPMLFFPGNFKTPAGVELPIPNAMKGPLDEFLWVPGGTTYNSVVRIYAAPTLTAQLGIAICMGNSAVANKLKSPWSDVGGNCVVFAVKPQCKNGGENSTIKKDKNNPNEIYDEIVEDVRDSGTCLQSQKGPQVTEKGGRSSPFDLYNFSSENISNSSNDDIVKFRDKFRDKVDVNGGLNNQTEFSASFLGIIELETSAYIGSDDDSLSEENTFFIGDVDVLGGNYDVNKIRGGIRQGVRSLLIDNWLDPQIRYIANQLTKMHIDVKLPDPSRVIDNESQTIKDVADNFSSVWNDEDEKNQISSSTQRSDINYDNLNKLNKSISNPFDALASLMNESNIVNISMEPITVQIPMISAEDIDAYSLYLHQWIEVNTGIMNDWNNVLSQLVTKCSKLDNDDEKKLCYNNAKKNLDAYIEFKNGDWQKMQDQIYANLMVLQEYRNFPFEIYEWIHVIDRYMSEIISLIDNTISYLSYWVSVNSQRFVGYVDAIVLILNIIKTYQILINFSVEWGQNCGGCTNDTYDQYSCKLSMLCNTIQLPIIQIPNFKIPNITIDLSNVDMSLDIVLPKFNFQPISVQLPDLPNLPEPPSVGANIKLLDLPNIPLLPEPPDLPELPSFVPEVELELPTLPPAPELPKLPNEIESIIKVAKLIGKIYCIVKGEFGLVGESSVKAKIEQLTQRTYEVKWIDNIMDFTNWTVAPVHNYGLDYEISSYVDLQFNFSDFYNYLDTLTKSINNVTTSSVNWVNTESNKLVNDNDLGKIQGAVDGASLQLNVDLSKADNQDIKNLSVDGVLSNEIEYTDYNTAKLRLKDVLSYFKDETKDTNFADSIASSVDKIENQIDKVNVVDPNIEGLEKIKNDVALYFNDEKSEYHQLADLINNDYNGFLAMVGSDILDSQYSGSGKSLVFNVQLFNVDSSTKDTIQNITKENPYEILLNNKQEIIDGYQNAINSNTADDLGLTNQQYLALRNRIGSLRNQVTTLYSVTKPISSTQLVAKNSGINTNKSLVSAAGGEGRLGSNLEVADVIDPSAFSKGIYEKITSGVDKGKLAKVVYSDSFVGIVGDNHYQTSHDKDHNIVLWDENGAYLKCVDQKCSGKDGGYNGYYHSKTVKEVPYEETWLDFDRDTKLKIADVSDEVKNWKLIGQTYDSLSFSWELRDGVDAYLIKLVDRVDYSYEKVDLKASVVYILALPDSTNLQDLYSKSVKLELLNKVDKIEKLYGKDLVQIVYYDSYKDLASIVLSNVDRKWYYARISALNLDENTYKIGSPWSNQVVAGKQILGDDQAPTVNPVLYRPSVNSSVSEGDDLNGYVGTKYKLIVNWKDNAALYYISLSKNGVLLDEKYTSNIEDSVSTNIGVHNKEGDDTYTTVGIDQFGNVTEKKINVHYSVPEITITDISKNADGESVAITAELSQDLDQGNVSFQRRRGNVWKTITPKIFDESSLLLVPGKFKIVGSPYSIGNDVAMYDKDGNVIALMNPDTAEIKLESGYTDSISINVIVQNNAFLQIYDKKSSNLLFLLSIPPKECVKVDAGNYKVVDLSESGNMWMFNGGKAIYKDGMNLLFISPTCQLYSELGLEGTYEYDREMEVVVFTLYEYTDTSKSNPIKIWFKVSPMSTS